MIRANYESDAGKRKQVPPEEYGTIPHTPFEEYSEKLKHCLMMKRENGILEARLHTNGNSMQWGAAPHQALHYFFDWAGRDPDNEIIILGGTGKDFTKGIGRLGPDGKWLPATKPELEIYDAGMINNLAFSIQRGHLKRPLHIQFVLGVLGGIPATVSNLNFLYNSAREALGEFTWSTCAVSRFQFPMCTVAMIMGGNCRVGMEDNLYVSKGVLAKSNAELVEKMVRIMREFGNEPATPDEAREILKLKGQDKVNF